MKPPSFLVEYRDSPRAQKLTFGPYATNTLATNFVEDLPEPLPGGYKRYTTLQPFTHNEAHVVRDLILSKRLVHA